MLSSMLSVGGSILIAVTTALVTIGLNELVRWLRERAERNLRSADWEIGFASKDTRIKPRIVILENSGGVPAFDVDITVTGDADIEIHPDAPLDKCRPRDAILVIMNTAGTGVFRVDWKNAKGVQQGPVFRFPTT